MEVNTVNIRKFLALMLAAVMIFALLAACGDKDDGPGKDPGTDPENSRETVRRYKDTRTIQVGIWWDPSGNYDSNRLEVNPSDENQIIAQMRLENMRALEEQFNIRLEFVDMTFNGARESISTSVMAGTPDVDIYCVDLQWSVPLVLGGFCLPVSEYATDPNGDLYAAMPKVFSPLNMCNLEQTYLLRTADPGSDTNSNYMLGYNKDLLDSFSQPDPQELWEKGEWTWSAWLDIMRAVTDTNRGTYGFGDAHEQVLGSLLMSNGASIALSAEQGLTSQATIEVLNLVYDIHNTDKVARPWNDSGYWENSYWEDGTLAFFPWIPWRAQQSGITRGWAYGDWDDCPYIIRVVHWPVGPSGNKATNSTFNLSGNVWMIPKNVPQPDIVYDVFFGYNNWYDYDLSLRDEDVWTEPLFGDDQLGWKYALEAIARPQFDMYSALGMQNADGGGFYTGSLLAGETTVAQFTQSWSLIVQNYIDVAYGKE
jgi:hypothetical protein